MIYALKSGLDMQLPIEYISMNLVEELKTLAPFGKGNEKPIFADKNLKIKKLQILGKAGNRQDIYRTHIFRTQRIPGPVIIQAFSVPINLIRQTAGLCTSSPVSASSSDHAAHQALTGITITEGSVNETLDFHMRGIVNFFNFFQ